MHFASTASINLPSVAYGSAVSYVMVKTAEALSSDRSFHIIDERLLSMRREHPDNGQSSYNPNSDDSGADQSNMKETMDKENSLYSDTASTVDTDYSSESSDVEHYLNGVAHSPKGFSLSDARMALSYVKGKMKQQEKTHAGDSQGKLPSSTKPPKSSSKTYSSFHRPEKNVIHHKMELLKNDEKKTFNIYTSNFDFVERSVSISMIEDAPTVKVIPAKYDNQRHALRRSASKVKFPSLPPLKPPPLQVHTTASRKHTHGLSRRSKSTPSSMTHDEEDVSDVTHTPIKIDKTSSDDEVSAVTHVEIANMASVIVDLESSNDCCDLLSSGT